MHHHAVRGSSVCTAALAAMSLALAPAAASSPLNLAIASGTPQTAPAWVAARADRFETKFDAALVVRGAPPKTKVRFRCITRGCEFPASDQPETVTRVDPRTYDVTGVKGQASITLTIWTVTPETVVVEAQAAKGAHGPPLRFLLTAR